MALCKQDRLVKKAMDDLRSGSAILTHDWLSENKCNGGDALYVAESIAHAINMYHFNGSYPHRNNMDGSSKESETPPLGKVVEAFFDGHISPEVMDDIANNKISLAEAMSSEVHHQSQKTPRQVP